MVQLHLILSRIGGTPVSQQPRSVVFCYDLQHYHHGNRSFLFPLYLGGSYSDKLHAKNAIRYTKLKQIFNLAADFETGYDMTKKAATEAF